MEDGTKLSPTSGDNDDSQTLTEVDERNKEKEKENEDEDDEEYSEEFTCCICLDLLYKPVVFACGHISCFWCVFTVMNTWHESHCPICRHPYNHFPSVCQLLHFLFMKLYPLSYKRRERQVGEEEKKSGHFSPQFDHNLFKLHHSKGSDVADACLQLHQTKINSESPSGKGKSSPCMDSAEANVEHADGSIIIPAVSSERLKSFVDADMQEFSVLGESIELKTCNLVSVGDLSCAACGKLLFHPLVLNCGHVYCESCMFVAEDGIRRCLVCQSLHPHGLPSVCLIIDHFVEQQFPELYVERREDVLRQINGSTCTKKCAGQSSSFPKTDGSWWFGNGPKIYPIIGERYRCKDCVETIGFDLCEACHNNPAKIPGRFNQQHKAEHEFDIMQPASVSDMLSWMDTEFSDDMLSWMDTEFSDDDSLNPLENIDISDLRPPPPLNHPPPLNRPSPLNRPPPESWRDNIRETDGSVPWSDGLVIAYPEGIDSDNSLFDLV